MTNVELYNAITEQYVFIEEILREETGDKDFLGTAYGICPGHCAIIAVGRSRDIARRVEYYYVSEDFVLSRNYFIRLI